MNTPPNDRLLGWAPDGLTLCLLKAARRALDLQKGIAPACKPDGTLVTPADTEIEGLLEEFLAGCVPDQRVIGEETLHQKGPGYLQAALAGKTWVIDPVDGTVLFAMGMAGWGISLGSMENGVLTQGVVVFPTRTVSGDRLCFIFTAGGAPVCQSEILLPPGCQPDLACVDRLTAAAAPMEQLVPVAGYPGLMAVSHRVAKQALYVGRHPLVSLGSCVATFKHLLDGGIVAYLVKLKLWDAAAVLPMAWRLGLRACLADGTPLDLDVMKAGWITDPRRPDFLSLSDHVLFYRSDRVGPEILADFRWPPLG
jgi:fructose-1,6-bisphosphatase/inositol monophosphatase family enzyme